MTLVFSLSDYGRTFATRERGSELLEELLALDVGEAEVMIDLEGVANFSYSFADEFFGKLAGDHGIKVVARNGSSRLASILTRAIQSRDGCVVSS